MKKYLIVFAAFVLCAALLFSCGRGKDQQKDETTIETYSFLTIEGETAVLTEEDGSVRMSNVFEEVTVTVKMTDADGKQTVVYKQVTNANGTPATKAVMKPVTIPVTVWPTDAKGNILSNPETERPTQTYTMQPGPAIDTTVATTRGTTVRGTTQTEAYRDPKETYKDPASHNYKPTTAANGNTQVKPTTAATTKPVSTAPGETLAPTTTEPADKNHYIPIYYPDYPNGTLTKGRVICNEALNYQKLTDMMVVAYANEKFQFTINSANVHTLEDGKKQLTLDFPAAFLTVLGTAQDSEKELCMKAVVNTYIDNMKVDKVLITIDGQPLVSGSYKMTSAYGKTAV